MRQEKKKSVGFGKRGLNNRYSAIYINHSERKETRINNIVKTILLDVLTGSTLQNGIV